MYARNGHILRNVNTVSLKMTYYLSLYNSVLCNFSKCHPIVISYRNKNGSLAPLDNDMCHCYCIMSTFIHLGIVNGPV